MSGEITACNSKPILNQQSLKGLSAFGAKIEISAMQMETVTAQILTGPPSNSGQVATMANTKTKRNQRTVLIPFAPWCALNYYQ